MKRVFPLLPLVLSLLLFGGSPLRSQDKPAAEAPKVEEKKGPSIDFDMPDSKTVIVERAIPEFSVKIKRENFEGEVSVSMTVFSDAEKKKEAAKKVVKKIAAKDSSENFIIPEFKDGSPVIVLEAVAGDLKASKEIALTIRKPDPTGDITGDQGMIGTSVANPPDPSKYNLPTLNPQNPDSKDIVTAINVLSQWMKDSNDFDKNIGENLNKTAAHAGKTRVATNLIWTLVCGFLVMFMQAGFALVETGLTRAKNVAHTMSMNFMVYGIGMLGFWICGFAIMFGGSKDAATGLTWGGAALLDSEYSLTLGEKSYGLFGHEGFFLLGRGFDIGIMALFLFQMVFMDTTATIPTGTMAERWRFFPFVIFGFFVSMIIYPVFGNWVWGGGWLSQLGVNNQLGHGHVDFAGSSVVHMVGGVTAIAGGLIIGPRIGKYNKDGSVNALPAHNVPMYFLGTFILALGWFGFNPGSALQMGNDFIAVRAAVNTMLASAAGAFASMVYMWVIYKKPDPSFMCNGMLAGLVAITAPCAFVTPWASVLIGLIAGVLVIWSCLFWEKIAKIDDPVGAISVHGVNGAWGVLSLGLFADGTYGKGWNGAHWLKDAAGKLSWVAELPATMPDGVEEVGVSGLFYGNSSQFVAECVGVGANIAWVFLSAFIFFWIIEKLIGNRVSAEDEIQGLDIPEMGVLGYINDDPKMGEGHILHPSAEPRPAMSPTNGEKRFTVVVQGADQESLTKAWSDLCQPGSAPPAKDFLLVYPHMTTVQGNRFRFRGGDAELIRAGIERLLTSRIGGKSVKTTVE